MYSGVCKPCAAEYAKEWRAKNPGYKKPKDTRDPALLSFIRARRGDAKQRSGAAASVDELYEIWMKQGGKCAISGVPMDMKKGSLDTGSLDQIIPGRGYSADNVQWLTWRVNRAKGEQTLDEFYSMCKSVLLGSGLSL